MDVVEVVEIDLPFCALTYGEAPCTAALGVTGARKCFNTRRTCQDTENFDPEPLTLRFVRPSIDLPYDAIPSLRSISVTPQVLDPGGSMGQRESVQITLDDHQHSDAGLDKYLADRTYDPFTTGSFWGKLRARVTTFKGLPLRVRRGPRGTPLEELTTYHYVIEATAGPDGRSFSITAKDFLKVADSDRAQAPRVSRGQVAAAIGAADSSLTLEPAGIGDAEYPPSGKVCLGGSEIAAFTRVGDVLTLTERGSSNTEAQDHAAGVTVQVVLEYVGESPADIIYDLLTNYTATDPGTIPLGDWQTDINDNIGRLYSAEIPEPTGVRDLINELIEQVGLVMWADLEAQQIRLTALRAVSPSATVYTADRIVQGSFSVREQPGKRISQAWTWFNLANPVEDLSNRLNFRSAAIRVDLDSEVENNDEAAIKKVFSRWIGAGNRLAAERLNELLIARYRTAPRLVTFQLWATDTIPALGSGVFVSHYALQDDTGELANVPVQVVSVEPQADRFTITAEEVLFTDVGLEKTIVFDVDEFNVNLRERFDELYLPPELYDVITFIIPSGVTIGSQISTTDENHEPAVDVGDWPEGVVPRLVVNGRIQGIGGRGGYGGNLVDPAERPGRAGGPALYTRAPIVVENNGGIFGGGGGGAGADASLNEHDFSGGGGGAGYLGGEGGVGIYHVGGLSFVGAFGGPGTKDAGGEGGAANSFPPGTAPVFTSGAGGGPGLPGESSGPNPGGAAGVAVDGDSFITWAPAGDIRGAQIN